MKPGPKPTPPQLKVVRGTADAKKAAEQIAKMPKPKPVPPDCPSFLTAAAKREWKKVVPELDRFGLLTLVDGPALAIYCQAWADYESAVRIIKRDGIIVRGFRNVQTKNPACQIARDNALLIRAFASEFGLTPSSRSQFKAMEVPDEDQDIYDT